MRAGLLLCSILFCACGGGREGVTYETLRGANLESEYAPGGRLILADGAFEASTGNGATERVRIVVRGEALGDVDGDGVMDGVLVLATQPSAGGPFIDLALVVDRAGQPIHAATFALGEAVQLSGVSVEESGVVRVDLRVHAAGDAPSNPSAQAVRRFAFEGGRLVER